MSGSLCSEGIESGPSGPFTLVENQFGLMQNFATAAYNVVLSGIDQLAGFSVDDVNVNPSFNAPHALSDFSRPVAPTINIDSFTLPDVPVKPDIPDVGTIVAGSIPTFTATEPSINLPPKPDAFSATIPSEPSTPPDYAFPDDPDTSIPAVPTLRDLQLPTLGTIDLDGLRTEFEALRLTRPDINADLLAGLSENIVADTISTFNTMKGKLDVFLAENPALALSRTRLAELLGGDSIGLPASVEAQMRSRAYQDVDDQSRKEREEILYGWSAKGHTLSDGALNAQLADSREKARNTKAGLNRDIYINAQQIEIQNLQFAVGQGIAWEGAYRQSYSVMWAASHDVAWHLFNAAESIFNARSRLYELQLKVFETDIQAFEQWLKVELSVLDVYRSQLEASKLIGELNLQDLEAYKQQLAGVQINVEVFKAKLEAINLKISKDAQQIAIYKERVSAFGALADVKKTEWQGYSEAIKGEIGKADIFDSLSKAFGSRVQAYTAGLDAQKSVEQFKIEKAKLFLERFARESELFRDKINAEQVRLNSSVSIADNQVRLFDSNVRLEQTAAEVGNRQFQLELEEGKMRADLELKKADLDINQVQRATQLQLGALEAATRAGAQLAGSAMSAVHASAGVSTSASKSSSTSCSTSYSIDATP